MTRFNLHTDRRGNQLIIEGLHRGDNGIRTFEFLFLENGKPFCFPSNCTATFYARLPDGTILYESPEMSRCSVTYSLCGGTDGTSITSIPGIVSCEIRIISQEGDVLTSPEFSFYIEDVLQDDGAIEAQDSFSALTEALGRVLDAETGLDSKVDRVYGTEGNTVVFGKDGTIKDGGGSGKVYVFPYDESKTAEIAALASTIKADKGNYAVYIQILAKKVPATIVFGQKTNISATHHESQSYKYDIYVSSAGNVTFATEPLYVYDTEKLENTAKAPTGAVVMQYVQDYVAENGGGEDAVSSVNGKTGTVELCAEDVGADPAGKAVSKITAHNQNVLAHNDIRLLIEELTTSKSSVSDIIDNLTTNVSNKPLSAAQGVTLKALIDAISVPTKLSELTGDSTHRTVTDTEKLAWITAVNDVAKLKNSGIILVQDGSALSITDSEV